ncbi:olfactory receptor 7A17-like [Hippopotamus amphibius kiboko]|uniref:olfactory receptor 7A17-like n=1 Tax=Hippopotamus amphibius kiboko TaxID=575201 RepID=UPI0025962C95|nr:olfactory receptor 7A17-like [Hippopotamus amphibius kiboko]
MGPPTALLPLEGSFDHGYLNPHYTQWALPGSGLSCSATAGECAPMIFQGPDAARGFPWSRIPSSLTETREFDQPLCSSMALLQSLHHNMLSGNSTHNSEFFLQGLSNEPELQSLIFVLFLSMYLITVFGNLLIILAVSSDSHLYTPMYFFLSNLSFADICFTTTTILKMLVNIQTQSNTITYEGCITQMYFYIHFAVLDDFLLAVMAYDRFVAICHPLHYTVIMNPQLCELLVLVFWIISALHSLLESLMILRLSFCTDLEIPHFFCEIKQVVRLACCDTFLNDTILYVTAVLLGGVPLAGILCSYSKIVFCIHGITSAQGKYKAFSTCASHLSVVSLYYSTSIGVYLCSAAPRNSRSRATVSVMYTVVTPMLNPFIYSLRNKDIKRALKRVVQLAIIKREIVLGLKKST